MRWHKLQSLPVTTQLFPVDLYLPHSDSQTAAPRSTCPPWTETSADPPWGRCYVKRWWSSGSTAETCPDSPGSVLGWRYPLKGSACSWWSLEGEKIKTHAHQSLTSECIALSSSVATSNNFPLLHRFTALSSSSSDYFIYITELNKSICSACYIS